MKDDRMRASIERVRDSDEVEYRILSYLTIKSNSEKASMMIPSSVETAPCTTGANICSTDIAIRLSRLPIDVTKP